MLCGFCSRQVRRLSPQHLLGNCSPGRKPQGTHGFQTIMALGACRERHTRQRLGSLPQRRPHERNWLRKGCWRESGTCEGGQGSAQWGHVVGNDPCAPSRASIPYEPSPRRAQEAKGRGVRNLCSARHAPSHQVLEGAELGQCRCSGGVSGSPSVSESKGSRSSVESRWEACSCLQTSPNGLGVVG